MHFAIIPETWQPVVERAVQQAFPDTVIDDLILLSGGLSGAAVYRLTLNGHPYTLKLDPTSNYQGSSLSGLLSQVSAAGIAPRLYYYDETTGVTITDFIISQPLQTSMAPDRIITALGTSLRTLHGLPYTGQATALSQTIDGLITSFRESNVLSGPIVTTVLAQYERIKAVHPWRDKDLVLAHNDLNPGNILSDGKQLWLIDWDTASPNDRFVDLAAAANFFAHTEAQEQLLLHTYFSREPGADESARLFLMRQVSRLIYGMLLSQAAAKMKPAGYKYDQEMEAYTLARFAEQIRTSGLSLGTYEGLFFYAKANLNEGFRNMHSARFEACLSLLANQ